ncbi:hypothetical protein [Streptomyces sp. H34-S4]|uniref:hypothetical protein n=1 Tax=Streptomyces sp. H34-S4 TaxID=2996463 RepID=UPI00226F7309|nr:hypothetical protein [Streptomyces sp. H34-S4]MCY0939138.1 hypothetical protein [Streptomyces sp. H34-S4]
MTRSPGSAADRAALVALFHAALVDTQISTSGSTYAYARRRPVTAIRTGAITPDTRPGPRSTRPRPTRAATTLTLARPR